MAEVVTFPHAGSALLSVLNAGLASRAPGVKAYDKVPRSSTSPGTSEFIVVKITGGLNETIVTGTPLVTIEAYAPKDARAYELCDLALAIIRSQDGVVRGARGFGYPQNLPDPTTSQVRYTSTGEVRVWGTATP